MKKSDKDKDKKHICPQCSVGFSEQNLAMPFCSKRCQELDLGAWADEKYAIPGTPEDTSQNAEPSETDEY